MNHAGVEDLFSQWDEDKSGYIEKSELQTAIPNADRQTVDQVLKVLDNDGDGKISLQELEDGLHNILGALAGTEQSEENNNNGNTDYIGELPSKHSSMDRRWVLIKTTILMG